MIPGKRKAHPEARRSVAKTIIPRVALNVTKNTGGVINE